MRWIIVLIVSIGLSILAEDSKTPLGLPVVIEDLYISGAKVEPIPRLDNSSSLVIRIIQAKPGADGFRYTFNIYGLDPGSYDIGTFLRYADTKGAVAKGLHQLEITTKHSLDTLPKPEELEIRPPPKLGGYRATMITLAVLWLIGLGLLIFYGRKKKGDLDISIPEPTLQEKLQKLVIMASKGELDDTEQARLERLIIGHWKEELPEINELPPTQALMKLRKHEKASPLILKLEQWLHSPNANIDQAEIEPLLAPYGKRKIDE